MEKKIQIMKVSHQEYNWKKPCKSLVEAEIRFEDECLGISANLLNPKGTNIIRAGQCLEDLNRCYPELRENEIWRLIYALWDCFHLNDLHAGTPEQEKLIHEQFSNLEYDYEEACNLLKENNLYTALLCLPLVQLGSVNERDISDG